MVCISFSFLQDHTVDNRGPSTLLNIGHGIHEMDEDHQFAINDVEAASAAAADDFENASTSIAVKLLLNQA